MFKKPVGALRLSVFLYIMQTVIEIPEDRTIIKLKRIYAYREERILK